jgi:Fe-S-cluster containining protein
VKLILDNENKVNYDKLNKSDTLADLLIAVDEFLAETPLPCGSCEESCCKKEWSVEMDNVCVNRLNHWDDKLAEDYVKNKLVKKRNYYRDFNQLVLNKNKACTYITESNLCTIYENRPIICRLYICTAKSYRYNLLRELIGSTYLKALILEDRMRTNDYTDRTITKYKKNPAVFAKGYDILLEDIFNYAESEGWLDLDERQQLYL